MGLFSSSKSSKTEYNTNQSAGFSEVSGPVNSINASNSTVSMNVTDRGAVDRAFRGMEQSTARLAGVANKAISEVAGSQRNALNFGSTSLTKVLDFARSTNSEAQRQVKQTNENFTNKFSEFANRQSNSNDQRMTDVAKWAIGGTLALAAFNAWRRSKAA